MSVFSYVVREAYQVSMSGTEAVAHASGFEYQGAQRSVFERGAFAVVAPSRSRRPRALP